MPTSAAPFMSKTNTHYIYKNNKCRVYENDWNIPNPDVIHN